MIKIKEQKFGHFRRFLTAGLKEPIRNKSSSPVKTDSASENTDHSQSWSRRRKLFDYNQQ